MLNHMATELVGLESNGDCGESRPTRIHDCILPVTVLVPSKSVLVSIRVCTIFKVYIYNLKRVDMLVKWQIRQKQGWFGLLLSMNRDQD